MHRHALLVDEGMVGVITEEFRVLARGLQGLLEVIDSLRRDVIVLVGEVALERNLDVRSLDRLLGGQPVEGNRRCQLGDLRRGDHRHRPAHAITRDADLGPVALEVLDRTANILLGGVEEIQRRHLLGRAVRVMIGHDDALVEVRRQGVEPREREAIDHRFDLLRQPPPFLDDDDPWRVAARGVGEIALGVAAVGAFERDLGAH